MSTIVDGFARNKASPPWQALSWRLKGRMATKGSYFKRFMILPGLSLGILAKQGTGLLRCVD